MRLVILAIAGFLLCCAGALVLPTGCATTQPALSREQAIYRAGTNVVAQAQTLLPFVPAPVATPVEVVLGIVSAALGAWNLHQQKAIKVLRNGSGNGAGKSPPSATSSLPSTLSAQPASTPLKGS